MLEVDGSRGEGGGQVLRTALALAAIRGEPLRIRNIRARRPKPGLRAQHLAAAQALAEICQADLEGAELGSTELTFRPGPVRPGTYRWEIGTAGATTLVLQTVVYPLLLAGDESRLSISGGTHNPMAPPVPYLEAVWLPAVRALGIHVELRLRRAGYFPRGGGLLEAGISPWTRRPEAPICWERRRAVKRVAARIHATRMPRRAVEAARSRLEGLLRRLQPLLPQGCPTEVSLREDPGPHPGSLVLVLSAQDPIPAGFVGFPEPRRMDAAAGEAVGQAETFLRSPAAVDPHLADQLVLPLALLARRGPGATFTTPVATRHLRTQAELVEELLGVPVRLEEEGAVRVRIGAV
jgi:RNA 3'-terminal phosphate cyclase (ATP)